MTAQTTFTLRTTIPAAGGAFAAVVLAVQWPPVSVAVAAAIVPLAVAAYIDARQRRLPDALVVAAVVPVVALVASTAFVDHLSPVVPALAGAALLAGPLLGLHLVSPAGMGFGDVKAGAALGAALGLVEPLLALWSLCLACGVAGAWGLGHRQRAVPFGPPLVVAGAAVLLVAAVMGVEAAAWR